jgi:hypothetical protein
VADKSPKHEAEDILKSAGPRGRFVTVLYRFRMLGWVLAIILMTAIAVDYIIRGAVGPQVLVVNERGEFLGQIDFYSTRQRTESQLIGAGMAFLNYKLSLNSSTIFQDFNNALAMMTKSLRDRELSAMQSQVDPKSGKPALLSIEDQKTRSWIDFGQGANAPRIEGTKNGRYIARFKGTLVVVGAQRVEKPFDVTLAMVPVTRTAANPLGIEVEEYNDN